jgi:hypothetical protein
LRRGKNALTSSTVCKDSIAIRIELCDETLQLCSRDVGQCGLQLGARNHPTAIRVDRVEQRFQLIAQLLPTRLEAACASSSRTTAVSAASASSASCKRTTAPSHIKDRRFTPAYLIHLGLLGPAITLPRFHVTVLEPHTQHVVIKIK